MKAPQPHAKPRSRLRWYQLYFALAAFDLATILCSLRLNQLHLTYHSQSVTRDKIWADRLNRFAQLGILARNVATPGANVFASHNPEQESQNMDEAMREFKTALARAETELRHSLRPEGFYQVAPIFGNIRSALQSLGNHGQQVFSCIRKRELDQASGCMADLNRDMCRVDDALAKLSNVVRSIQSGNFAEQLDRAHSLQSLASGFGFAVILMVGAATVFGHKMASAMRRAEVEQEQHVAELQATHDQLEQRVAERTRELSLLNTSLLHEVEQRKKAVVAMQSAQEQVAKSARLAGMAEVATGVLHNVGNVLNSVSVSASLVTGRLKQSKTTNLCRATQLLHDQNGNLVRFLSSDPKGKVLPEYLHTVSGEIAMEQSALLREMSLLGQNIEHIKEIVAMQQSYAKVSGAFEQLNPADLVEDALRMHLAAFERHRVEVLRDFAPDLPLINVDRHKVLQILINLFRNAKHALDAAKVSHKQLQVRLEPTQDMVAIRIRDNGVGIAPENLTQIFGHGFTTKKEGHGFGLHSGANAAREMAGRLTAQSAGLDQGAEFTLELPIAKTKSILT